MGSLLPVRRRRWARWFASTGFGAIVLTAFRIHVNRHADASSRHSLGYLVVASVGEVVVVAVLVSIANRWLPWPRALSRPRALRTRRRELPPATPWRRDGG